MYNVGATTKDNGRVHNVAHNQRFFPTYVDNYDICKQLYLSLKEILAMWELTHPGNAPWYNRINVCWFSIGCFGYDVRVYLLHSRIMHEYWT